LTLNDLRLILITIAVVSAALVAAGVLGIIRSRTTPAYARTGTAGRTRRRRYGPPIKDRHPEDGQAGTDDPR
jgi:hypothetical protein